MIGIDPDKLHCALRAKLLAIVSTYAGFPGPIIHTHFPSYGNIGDSLLWLAEEQLLTQVFAKAPVSLPTMKSFQRYVEDNALVSGTVFLRGGGNFGSLWQWEHEWRLQAMQIFPQAVFVQLPQSILFDDSVLLERTRAAISSVEKFILLPRDLESEKIAKREFDCECTLSPDSAFFSNLTTIGQPKKRLLYLLRTCKESSLAGVGASWADTLWSVDDRLTKRLQRFAKITSSWPRTGLPSWASHTVARRRLQKGVTLLSSAECVITDRLHGHILCTKLGIPHVVIDTAQRKVRNLWETWTTNVPYCTFVDNLDQAEQAAEELLSRYGSGTQ